MNLAMYNGRKSLRLLPILILPFVAMPVHAVCEGFHELLPFVPASGWPNGWQGFVRIENAFNRAESIRFTATDDAGYSYSQEVEVGAQQSLHFNSEDLEFGNDAKGGLQGVGTAPVGHWRLCFTDLLFAKVGAYIRTSDGLVTDMTLVIEGDNSLCEVECPEWRVPIFNPASNRNQVSFLRIVNNSDLHKPLYIFGVREDGVTNRDANGDALGVAGFLPAREAVEITSSQLETGVGIRLDRCNPSDPSDCVTAIGSIGPARGKWALFVHELSNGPSEELVVMNLMRTPTGHVTNLSAGGNDTWIRR